MDMQSKLVSFFSDKRKRFIFFNVVVAFVYAIALVICIVFLCEPYELKTVTGTITEYKRHQSANDFTEAVLDDRSYVKIELDGALLFHTSGEQYEKIDDRLFSEISVGDTLTIIYGDGGYLSNTTVYGIEYDGKTYLDSGEATSQIQSKRTTTVVVCSVIIGIATIWAIGITYFNFKKNR